MTPTQARTRNRLLRRPHPNLAQLFANDGITVVEWVPAGEDFTRRDCWVVWEPGKSPVEFYS